MATLPTSERASTARRWSRAIRGTTSCHSEGSCACAARRAGRFAHTWVSANEPHTHARCAIVKHRSWRDSTPLTGALEFCTNETARHRLRRRSVCEPALSGVEGREHRSSGTARARDPRPHRLCRSVRTAPTARHRSRFSLLERTFLRRSRQTAAMDSAHAASALDRRPRRRRTRSLWSASHDPGSGEGRLRLHLHRYVGIDGRDRRFPDARAGGEVRGPSVHRAKPAPVPKSASSRSPGPPESLLRSAPTINRLPPNSTRFHCPMAQRRSATRSNSPPGCCRRRGIASSSSSPTA